MAAASSRNGSLNLATTPKQDLSIRRELDDIALQTIHEIALNKALKLTEEPDSAERVKM